MESRLHIERLTEVMELAKHGCLQVHKVLDDVIRQNTQYLMERLKA